MTSLKYPIRQASLFTSWGLIDPRLMPEHFENTLTKESSAASASTTRFRTSIKSWLEHTITKISRKNPAHS